MEKFEMLAKTFAGLEDVLKDELIEIGATDVEVVTCGVKFTGTKETLYKANFCCRTALRILRVIGCYQSQNADELYESVKKVDWTEYFDISQSFSVSSTVYSEAFNNSMFISLKTKDAIIDQFRAKTGKRPSFNMDNPDIRVNIHVSPEDVTLSLDSSGESLHKRGYRLGQNDASMSEVLAAGILKLAGWKGQTDLYDPMCGSGTISIEAALIARNIPPGIFRKSFAFENWKDFDADIFDEVYNADYEVPFENQIYASDIISGNVRMSSDNARNAGLKTGIHFEVKDFAVLKASDKKGIVIINPPYSERKNEREIMPIYKMIGTTLKSSFSGFNVWIISSSEEGFDSIGLRYDQKIELNNGSIDCSLRKYDLYEGSRKMTKQFDDRPSFEQHSGGRDFGDRPRFNDRSSDGDRPRFNSDKPRFDNDKPRFDNGRPRFDSDKPRFNNDKPRFNNDKPRFDSDKPRFDSDQPRFDHERPRYTNENPRFGGSDRPRTHTRPAFDGDKPKPDFERPKRGGTRPRISASGAPKPDTETPEND